VDAGLFLHTLGDAMSRTMRFIEVPDLIVQQWRDAWELMVVDRADEESQVDQLVAPFMQAMTHAREITRVYGHE